MSFRRSQSFVACQVTARAAVFVLTWMIVSMLATSPAWLLGDESHDFGFVLESPSIADLDATSTITGRSEEVIPFTIGMDLGTTKSGGTGITGWSCSVWTAGFEIDSITVDGTISAAWNRGGLVDQDASFVNFTIVDPKRNGGRTGVVQAVVLSFIRQTAAIVGHRHPIGRIDCSARITTPGRIGFARYDDNLRGDGQVVVSVVTADGQTVTAALEHRNITIGSGATTELCDDGVDNDGDSWIDSDDPDCQPPRAHEICDDGVDNDEDGAIDCEDSECRWKSLCPPVEICGDEIDNEGDGVADCDDFDCVGHSSCIAREDCQDGIDNDNDGLVDCDDRECGGVPPCPEIERCFDFMDNDGDGFIDCDDPDCDSSIFCGFFENCRDGRDNNGDGFVDCEDPQCAQGPTCGDTEDCEDGVDNDDDGFVDCDDSQCIGVGPCPGPERCADGIDNDLNGLTDCDDPDCAQRPFCIDAEVCDDGIDNDEDGLVDCDDDQCRGRGPCPGPELCSDGFDNDQDGKIDCEDFDCRLRSECLREICGDGIDNDIDGLADCDDPECAGVDGCTTEICDNGIDDDEDGFADCDDPGCWNRNPCSTGESGFDLVLTTDGVFRDNPGAGDDPGAGAGTPGDDPINTPTNVVEISYVSMRTIEVITFIVPFPTPQIDGIQGWSLSIAHDADLMKIVGTPTIEGTDAGDLISGGFEKTEIAGSENGRGAGGFNEEAGVVSAVVLTFTQPIVLDPEIAQSILRTTYELGSGLGVQEASPALIRFKDGLQGAGQRVTNQITVAGISMKPSHLVPLEIRRVGLFGEFVRGDINTDGRVDISDAIWALNDLMRGGPPTLCPGAADVNDDGKYDISDPIFLVQYRFLQGRAIPAPYPNCGIGRGETTLPCPEGASPRCIP